MMQSNAPTPETAPEMAPETTLPAGTAGLAQSLSVTDWLNQGVEAAQSTMTAIAAHEPTVEEQRFLRFVLAGSDTALLPLESIHEVSQIPSRSVLPVPEMPDAVLGIANCRGAILWLVDLTTFLGLSSSSVAESPGNFPKAVLSHHTITIQAEGQSVGLVVPAVMDIEAYSAERLQQPKAELFSSHLIPFLAGYLDRTSSPVLSAEALIENLQMQR